jgi:DNA (cytosine-5)-methyltransferase 1
LAPDIAARDRRILSQREIIVSKDAGMKPTVIDLFAGVGGLSLGACRAGFKLRLAVDNDLQIFGAHATNFPKVRHATENILNLSGKQLLELAELQQNELGGLIGGPPCQGFSRIGRRDIADPRNNLFCKFFDLVRETLPAFYFAENVPGIMDGVYNDIRSKALSGLTEYVCLDPFEVCASDFGAPTNRTRVLFIGYRPEFFGQGFAVSDFAASEDVPAMIVRDALAGLPSKIKDTWLKDETGWRKVHKWTEGAFWERVFGCVPDGVGDQESLLRLNEESRVSGCVATDHTAKTRRRFARLAVDEVDSVSRARRLDPYGTCPTLRAGTAQDRGSYQAVRPIHPTEDRVITPREAARLQGFPDWFRFAPTKWHSFRQIGNSVSPILAEAILKVIRARLITPSAKLEQRAA